MLTISQKTILIRLKIELRFNTLQQTQIKKLTDKQGKDVENQMSVLKVLLEKEIML